MKTLVLIVEALIVAIGYLANVAIYKLTGREL